MLRFFLKKLFTYLKPEEYLSFLEKGNAIAFAMGNVYVSSIL
jgi:hypothetical protein